MFNAGATDTTDQTKAKHKTLWRSASRNKTFMNDITRKIGKKNKHTSMIKKKVPIKHTQHTRNQTKENKVK